MGRSWGLRLVARAAVALVAAGSAGAAHGATTTFTRAGSIRFDGRPAFPIVLSPGPPPGSATPWGTDGLAETVSAGVNVFKIGPGSTWTSGDIAAVDSFDEQAAALGAYTWVNLNGYARATPGSSQDAGLARVVRRLTGAAGGSAIAFWKAKDEPWWAGLPPAELRFAYCRVTSRGVSAWCHGEQPLAPGPLWVTIEAPRGTPPALAGYTAVTDVHGVDEYPVTLARAAAPELYQVGQWTAAIAAVTPGAPVWTTLQICASGSYDRSTGAFILPTPLQERYMAYEAILNGARALAFYGGSVTGCWNQTDARYGWNWTFWQSVLKPLVQELSASSPIAPALTSEAAGEPVTTNDPTTEAVLREGTSPDDLWLIAARSGIGTADVTFSGLPSWFTTGSVYTEGRTVATAAGSFGDSFGQWDVHVYHFVEPLTLDAQSPRPAKVGARVALRGGGLAAARRVTFGGYAAPFRIVSDRRIVAIVPPRARSGPIVVRSATSTVTTTSGFAVLPSVARRPRITGVARVGRVLTASTGRWHGDPRTHVAFRWQRCDARGLGCNAIHATHRRLRLDTGALGRRFRVIVTVRTRAGTAKARSAATRVVSR